MKALYFKEGEDLGSTFTIEEIPRLAPPRCPALGGETMLNAGWLTSDETFGEHFMTHLDEGGALDEAEIVAGLGRAPR